jgi:hypothetical protein
MWAALPAVAPGWAFALRLVCAYVTPLLAGLTAWGLGVRVFRRVWPAARYGQQMRRTRGEVLAYSWALGWGLISLELFALAEVHLPLPGGLGWTPPLVLAPWLVLAALLPLTRGRAPDPPAEPSPAGRAAWWLAPLFLACAALLLAQVGLAMLHATSLPLDGWDEWSIYGFKARVFFAHQGLPLPYFHDPATLFSHPDYPLLLPLGETWIYNWLGVADDWALTPLIPLFYAALLTIVYASLRRLAGPAAGLVGAAALTLVPVMQTMAGTANADLPFTLMATAACLSLLDAIVVPWRAAPALAMAGLWTGLAMWTKKEGLLLCGALALAVVVFSLTARRRAGESAGEGRGGAVDLARAVGRDLLAYGLPVLAVAGGWLLFLKRVKPLPRDFLPVTPAVFAAHVDRVPTIVRVILLHFTETKLWSTAWMLVVLLPALLLCRALLRRLRWRGDGAPRKRVPWPGGSGAYAGLSSAHYAGTGGGAVTAVVGLGALVVVVQIAGAAALFIFSSWQPFILHMMSSIDRLIAHELPLAIVLLVVCIAMP